VAQLRRQRSGPFRPETPPRRENSVERSDDAPRLRDPSSRRTLISGPGTRPTGRWQEKEIFSKKGGEGAEEEEAARKKKARQFSGLRRDTWWFVGSRDRTALWSEVRRRPPSVERTPREGRGRRYVPRAGTGTLLRCPLVPRRRTGIRSGWHSARHCLLLVFGAVQSPQPVNGDKNWGHGDTQ